MTPPVSAGNASTAVDLRTVARWAAAGRLVQSRMVPSGSTARTTLTCAVPQQRD